MNLESGVLQVHIEDIIPNRFQPRLTFDEQGLKELSDSIREHGIIQPLVLRKLGDKYEIIAGERRYKAAQMAGLTTVPAVIANIDDNKSAEVALVENVQRRDLTAIEEARSYRSLLDKGYLTQDQLAKRMGLSQPAIANKLRLLNLDEEVQQALLEEKISERHARTLLSLEDKEAQKEWLHRIINERLTVRQLDQELKKVKIANNAVPYGEEDEGTGEVPIINSRPSIEDIKANAMDIGLANRLESTQTKQVPEELETLDINPSTPETLTFDEASPTPFPNFNPNENTHVPGSSFTTATTIPEFNIATPNSVSTILPNESLDLGNEPNKFFDLKEDTNVSTAEGNAPSFMSPTPTPSNNNFEIFDAPTINNSFPTTESLEPITPTPPKPMSNDEMQQMYENSNPNSSFEMNPNNRFFTPVSTPPKEINIINNKTEVDIDPMDAVENLTNNNTVSMGGQKMELKDAIAAIRSSIESLGDKGFFIDVEEIDFDSNYQITMRIHKDN